MNKPGVTLFETLIVIALCALLVGLVVSSYRSFKYAVVRTQVAKLYSVCRYLQRRAMATHATQELHFDSVHNTYWYNNQHHALGSSVCIGCAPGVLGPPGLPTTPVAKPVTFVDDTMLFYPEGTMRAGTVYLKDNNNESVYALSCPVGAISCMRMYRYHDSGWQQIS